MFVFFFYKLKYLLSKWNKEELPFKPNILY